MNMYTIIHTYIHNMHTIGRDHINKSESIHMYTIIHTLLHTYIHNMHTIGRDHINQSESDGNEMK